MTTKPMRVLYASRAYESAHTEGGYLILRDLADQSVDDPDVQGAFFSTSRSGDGSSGLDLLPAYRRSGWGLWPAVEFARATNRYAAGFDILQTAHVPTPTNTAILRRIIRRARLKGPRYVQTVTALAEHDELRPEMFWGDAIVCLNEAASTTVRQFHGNVVTIAPAVREQRLDDRLGMPADMQGRLAGYKVVCVPVDLMRIGDFDLRSLAKSLLESGPDIVVVFACRFGEERDARRSLGPLVESHNDRVHIVATIDWMLDLLAASDVVIYPIQDLHKKFNPPLILLEAAALGSRLVTASSVLLNSLVADDACRRVASSDVADWTAAASKMINVDSRSGGAPVSFDSMYSQYIDLYRTLLDQSD